MGRRGDGVTRFVAIPGVMSGVDFATRERTEPRMPAVYVGSYMLRAVTLLPPLLAFDGVGTPDEDPVWALWPDRMAQVVEALDGVVCRDAPGVADFVRSPQRLIDQILSPEAPDLFIGARPPNAVSVLITEQRFEEALDLVEDTRSQQRKNTREHCTELIEYWKSLGCRRAPGDWTRYLEAPS
jgi:hypothetical protein